MDEFIMDLQLFAFGKTGNSTTIKQGATTIGEVTNIGAVALATDAIDITTLASVMREFIPGITDAGEVTISGNYYPGDVGQVALQTAAFNKTTDAYTITFPTAIGAAWTFNAFITGYTASEATNDDPLAFEVTLKITGVPSLGVTASGGLTALVLTGTAGAMSPIFANGKYNYSWTFTSLTSITVTPTAVAHTIDIYVDGVVFQLGVTSAAASNAITGFDAAATSKRIDIIVREANKTPKTYTVIAVRTA